MRAIVCALLASSSIFLCAGSVYGASPEALLKSQDEKLYQLFRKYDSLHPALSLYADKQQFKKPIVKLATMVHEIVHLDSAAHNGFYINGTYYEPYLRQDAWPSVRNKALAGYAYPHERGGIWSNYVSNTPDNHLGNVVDELNAYGHVMEFVCRNEPESIEAQVKNAIGLLHLQEIFLRATRLARPQEYLRLSLNRESVGAMRKVTDRLWKVLQTCGVPASQIPDAEISYIMRVAESR